MPYVTNPALSPLPHRPGCLAMPHLPSKAGSVVSALDAFAGLVISAIVVVLLTIVDHYFDRRRTGPGRHSAEDA